MDHTSGWRIVERCFVAGDGAAWEAFVERFETSLRWGIRRVLGNSIGADRDDLARDVLQDCYCKLLARERRALGLCRERDEKALNAYFSRLGERCARDALRARCAQKRGGDCLVSLTDLREELLPSRLGESPEVGVLMREAESVLHDTCRQAAGRKQHERNYRILVMAFVEGLSSREISDRLAGAISNSCVDSLVYRARRRLERQGGDQEFCYRRAVA